MLGRSLALAFPLVLAAAVAPHGTAAPLRVSRLVGDGMVMQRGAPVPVWGSAGPGDSVVVTFDGRRHDARADAAGAWRVTLAPMPAGGPHAMTIARRGDTVRVRDILVGDVWVASGQSNMEFALSSANDAAAEIAAATDAGVRHFKVPQSWAEQPLDTLAGGAWAVESPATARDFTAVGYFFARELRRRERIPIGIINTTWGGSRIEPWMSLRALGYDSTRWARVQADERAQQERTVDALRRKIGGLPTTDAGLVDGQARWAAPDLDDASWATIRVPAAWEGQGYDGLDGVAWYRTTFDLTADEAAKGVALSLGQIDDSDWSWVNGVEVGRTMSSWNVPRRYVVPASALRAGRNVLAVRVEDTGGGGGIHTGDLFVDVGGEHRALPAEWRFRVSQVRDVQGGQKNQIPTLLWNAMVHPLLPYPIAGVIWYQGEANANTRDDAVAYRTLFPHMIADWRRQWGRGDVPFLWVSLANFMAVDSEPGDGAWAVLRESQHAALALPKTGEAVAIDVGDPNDIHPRNKQEVGRRLALAARRVAYGETGLVASGPTFRGAHAAGDSLVVSFDHVGRGLAVGGRYRAGGALQGFAVAGADRRFAWARAELRGDRVVVWSDRVTHPVAVRYAWGDDPLQANLTNRDGLPAAPFRSDAW